MHLGEIGEHYKITVNKQEKKQVFTYSMSLREVCVRVHIHTHSYKQTKKAKKKHHILTLNVCLYL